MKILLDECVPRDLCKGFSAHDCQAAKNIGFGGKKNGELLQAAEQAGFEVLITVDKNMPHQQNLTARMVVILIIRAHSNKLKDLLPHVPDSLSALTGIRSGQILTVGHGGGGGQ